MTGLTSPQNPFMCPHTNVPWSLSNLSLANNYRTVPHVGIKIWVHYCKHLRFRYAVLNSKPKTGVTGICLGPCYFPPSWNLKNLETQLNHLLNCYWDDTKDLGKNSRRPSAQRYEQPILPGGDG
ncbi:hypothetical protein ACTXT7_010503 [Hymenolepis weldensis]